MEVSVHACWFATPPPLLPLHRWPPLPHSQGKIALWWCLSTGDAVGPVLAWAEPTSGSGVRSAADLQQWASWSTGLLDLHKGHYKGADFGRAPT
ncbi:unnamed protein product [Closterium sp. NIES-54]